MGKNSRKPLVKSGCYGNVSLIDKDLPLGVNSVEFKVRLLELVGFYLFGTEEAAEREWTIDEATQRFQSSDEDYWRTAFNQGVNLDEKILEGNACKKTPEDFIARHDLTFLTPDGHEIRCKVRKNRTGNTLIFLFTLTASKLSLLLLFILFYLLFFWKTENKSTA